MNKTVCKDSSRKNESKGYLTPTLASGLCKDHRL